MKLRTYFLDIIGLVGVVSLTYGLYLYDMKLALIVMGILFISYSIFKQIDK